MLVTYPPCFNGDFPHVVYNCENTGFSSYGYYTCFTLGIPPDFHVGEYGYCVRITPRLLRLLFWFPPQ